ncbi:uncharacterized protein LOC144828491 isoform X2 [Lissotriton helveticus]
MTSECSNPVSISRTYTLPSSAVSDIRIRTLEDAVACHGYSFQLIPQLELSSPGFQGDLVCEGLLPYLSLLHIYSGTGGNTSEMIETIRSKYGSKGFSGGSSLPCWRIMHGFCCSFPLHSC